MFSGIRERLVRIGISYVFNYSVTETTASRPLHFILAAPLPRMVFFSHRNGRLLVIIDLGNDLSLTCTYLARLPWIFPGLRINGAPGNIQGTELDRYALYSEPMRCPLSENEIGETNQSKRIFTVWKFWGKSWWLISCDDFKSKGCVVVGFDHGLPYRVKNMARGTQ